MEKSPIEVSPHSPAAFSRPSKRRSIYLSVFGLFLYFCLTFHPISLDRILQQQTSRLESPPEKHFPFNKIKPSKQLVFYPCYSKYQCARLEVPLDWQKDSNNHDDKGPKAAVALIRLPAKVPVTDRRYGGPIYINPGGPGGSGVHALVSFGKDVQTIADSATPVTSTASFHDESLYFDVIGFDPRGVNNTTPSASCFPDDFTRQAWMLQAEAQGVLKNNDTFAMFYARSKAVADSCTTILSDDDGHLEGIGKHMNTPVVVRDMVEIAERFGEWRENEAKKMLEEVEEEDFPEKSPDQYSAADAYQKALWKKGREEILYWGFSYGTLLGATLSAMYPERVKRVVLDGVCDAEDYYEGKWLKNLQDTDLILEQFYTQCFEAGPEHCAITPPEHTYGPYGIQEVFESAFETLKQNPLPVPANGVHSADVITYSNLYTQLKNALYQPHSNFRHLAKVIHDISSGNGTALAALKQSAYHGICPSQDCQLEGPWSDSCHNPELGPYKAETSAAIHCSDSTIDYSKHHSAEFFWENWQTLRNQSSALGDYWAEITLACGNWAIRPAWPLNTTITAEKTAHPILWVGNSRDPVTPVRNARRMASLFPGSKVLEQNSGGHCSVSEPSFCTAEVIRAYFQRGHLPKDGLVCQPFSGPFDADGSVEARVRGLGEPEEGMYQALRGLREGRRGFDLPLGI
ncbi:hypothetical protein K402DRAFT_393421 [Aulographum hederae CBS 113979]|uniref:Proteinase n=1 Tax=Aulographum hederae CBS 113979 TaxID=1176131 RepID=A0A6G1H0Q0_9PEZI|nr:hypothetical protein K402DRAFT_393421 [Aulographum hederae CBS 113979]